MSEKTTNDIRQYESLFNGEKILIETGRLAKLASGSVTVRHGETVILATAVVNETAREEVDFFPLLVDYEERLYAAGKISGSRFIKRETRPSDQAILTCRLIDRPIRPMFPKNYRNDIQIIITVLSFDGIHDPDILSIIGASAALTQTNAPFEGPIGAAKIGLIDGKLVVNPDLDILAKSDLELTIAGTKENVLMIEAGAKEVDEAIVVEAIKLARESYLPVIELQEKMANDYEGVKIIPSDEVPAIYADVKKYLGKKLSELVAIPDESVKKARISEFEQEVLANFEGNYKQIDLKSTFGKFIEKEIREMILETGKRPDGRTEDEIRPISCEVGLLPRTHGSALFTRGNTQALTIATLGSPGSEQTIETMEVEGTKKFMHHYNFPPFSTGEVKPLRGASRREIGHGALAEKALSQVIPDSSGFPYTIRLVSEILSSNGSSSMAATCGSTLALMDAGVPIKAPIAGIAMGMVSDEGMNKYRILTDIAGIEDFGGDMDFKVTGSKKGVTAIQLDTKTKGLPISILEEGLEKAKIARLKIIDMIVATIPEPRKEMSKYAPRIITHKINPDKIREVIGSGGKTINKLIADAGGAEVISIDIEQDGTVLITSADSDAANGVLEKIQSITKEAEVGEIYTGKVVRIMDFGAFVELWPGQDGMVHISELAPERVNKVTDVLKIGDEIKVKVIQIDEQGRVNLSKKRAEEAPENK